MSAKPCNYVLSNRKLAHPFGHHASTNVFNIPDADGAEDDSDKRASVKVPEPILNILQQRITRSKNSSGRGRGMHPQNYY